MRHRSTGPPIEESTACGSPKGRGLRRALRALLAGLVLLPGCGGESDDLTGTWTGAVVDSRGGQGGTTFRLSQAGSDLGGTWEFTFTSTSPFNGTGPLAGTVQGTSVSATLDAGSPCAFSVTATRTGDNLRGAYTSAGCTPARTGTLDLTRR